MKPFLAVLVLALLTACAGTDSIKTSGDQRGQETIRVLGIGRTQEQATKNGFRNAIEIVVGSVITSEREVLDNRLTREHIVEHSAGYIDDFKIIDTYTTNNGVHVVMDVTVKNSVIASKLLNRNEPGAINGARIEAQYKSYLNERNTGDAFLNTVLQGYPVQALTVERGKVDFVLNANRDAMFVVPYTVRWNYKYIQALNEALGKVQDTRVERIFDSTCMCYVSPGRVTVMAKDPKDWVIGSRNVYNFSDTIRVKKIAQGLDVLPYVAVTFFNSRGGILRRECFEVQKTFTSFGSEGVAVWGNTVEGMNAYVFVKPGTTLYSNIKNIDRVETGIVNSCTRQI